MKSLGLYDQDGYISSITYSEERSTIFGSYEYIFSGLANLIIFSLNETNLEVMSW